MSPVAMPANLEARREWQARQDETDIEPIPEPEHTSRDPWPASVKVPKGVADLKAWAEEHGWSVDLTYSRGTWFTKTTRSIKHAIAVRCAKGDRRAVAVYVSPVRSIKWTCASSLVLGPDPVGIYPSCNVTEVREYLERSGNVSAGWFEAITARLAEAAAKAKETQKSRPKKAKEAHA